MRGVVAVPFEVVVREDLRPLRSRIGEADAGDGALAREPGTLDAEAAAGVGGEGTGDLLLLVQELVLPGRAQLRREGGAIGERVARGEPHTERALQRIRIALHHEVLDPRTRLREAVEGSVQV